MIITLPNRIYYTFIYRIKALRFADDQAMVAKSQKGLQAMMDRLDIKRIWNEDQHQKDKGIVKERKLYGQN